MEHIQMSKQYTNTTNNLPTPPTGSPIPPRSMFLAVFCQRAIRHDKSNPMCKRLLFYIPCTTTKSKFMLANIAERLQCIGNKVVNAPCWQLWRDTNLLALWSPLEALPFAGGGCNLKARSPMQSLHLFASIPRGLQFLYHTYMPTSHNFTIS